MPSDGRPSSARRAHERGAMTMEPSAIRTRMRDPGLVAAPSTDAPAVRVTFEYVAWATVWLLAGTTIGLIARRQPRGAPLLAHHRPADGRPARPPRLRAAPRPPGGPPPGPPAPHPPPSTRPRAPTA